MQSKFTTAQWNTLVQWLNFGALTFFVGALGHMVMADLIAPVELAISPTPVFIAVVLVTYGWISMPYFIPPYIKLDQWPAFFKDPDYVLQREGEYLVYNTSGYNQVRRHFINVKSPTWLVDHGPPAQYPVLVQFKAQTHERANGRQFDTLITPL